MSDGKWGGPYLWPERGSQVTPPDSGEREVQHVVAAAFEYCRVDGEVAVHVPLPLAQRILAALREAGHSGEYARLADELRERLPR